MRHRRTPATIAAGSLGLAVLGALTLSACGASGQADKAPAPAAAALSPAAPPPTVSFSPVAAPAAVGPVAVTISNFMFGPAATTVRAGSTVTWTNQDEEPHTVVGSGLRSPVLGNQGSTYAYTFAIPGSYSYNCSIHPYMHGTVTVTS